MAIRKIRVQGDPCLHKKCREVTQFDPRLHQLLDDLADTLREANGAGLAAPQVGILRRVCIAMTDDGEIIELVNPVILEQEGEQTDIEGCLSIPNRYGIVTRPNAVRVRAQDRNGKEFEMREEGFNARCFCHEIDHLDGHLYTEHTDHLLSEAELEKYLEEHGEK